MRISKFSSLLVTSILVAAFAAPLFGHISVNPRTSEAGIHHKLFYVRRRLKRRYRWWSSGLK